MQENIIIIDDEQDFLDSLRRGLIGAGHRSIHLESDPRNALEVFKDQQVQFDLALIDITMPWISGIDLLDTIKQISPQTECIMITAVNDAKTAINCLKKGAYDYLVKPFERDELLACIERALEKRKLVRILDIKQKPDLVPSDIENVFSPIVTRSIDVLRVLKEAELHAQSNIPILITGESGTGKDLLAQAIHRASPRCRHTYTPVSMASLNAGLFDAEFLGHTKGAFTGAAMDRKGYLEVTHKGTLFLDEIGSMPLEFQGKLLRIFQDGEYLKLGTSKPRKVDIRFISATNIDIAAMMERGEFRKDFYYRLKGAWLHLPPLRDRKGDLPILIDYFLGTLPHRLHNGLSDDAMSILATHDFPGNIRELFSIIHYASNLADGKLIEAENLPQHLLDQPAPLPELGVHSVPEKVVPLATIEKTHIISVYNSLDRNKLQTARKLGIGINTLRRKLKSYGVE